MGLHFFLTHTWQMSSHRVGLQERRNVSAVVVSHTENSSLLAFAVLSAGTAVGPLSRRLCKNSPTAVVIDPAALWRQLGQTRSLLPTLSLSLPPLLEAESVRA